MLSSSFKHADAALRSSPVFTLCGWVARLGERLPTPEELVDQERQRTNQQQQRADQAEQALRQLQERLKQNVIDI